jgi:hypothetical protein
MWTIRGGAYDGRIIRIDSDLATRKGSAFLRLSRLKGDRRFVGWNPSGLPARVAFRADRSVSADDSVAFWSILNRMELDIGMRLFEPATLAVESDPDDIIVVDTKLMSVDDGRTYLTWSNNAGVYDARVYFRSKSLLHNTRIVTHEMMHALGFGHTSAWNSIMSPESWGAASLTPEDVAYAQFAFASRASSEREDMWERLALANNREPQPEVRNNFTTCPRAPFNVLSAFADCYSDSHFAGAIGASGTSH